MSRISGAAMTALSPLMRSTLPAQHVLPAEEFGDVAVARLVIDVAGRAGLLDLALLHHHHQSASAIASSWVWVT